MKKITITLSIIFAIFLSFGFIVMQKPSSKVELEQVSDAQISESNSELAVMQETNDEKWID